MATWTGPGRFTRSVSTISELGAWAPSSLINPVRLAGLGSRFREHGPRLPPVCDVSASSHRSDVSPFLQRHPSW
jgi:hypothetical protein